MLDVSSKSLEQRDNMMNKFQTTKHEFPSIAYGNLGPYVTKKLHELWLLLRVGENVANIINNKRKDYSNLISEFLDNDEQIRNYILSVGIPIVKPNGVNAYIPPNLIYPTKIKLPLKKKQIDEFSKKAWIDLRLENIKKLVKDIMYAYKDESTERMTDLNSKNVGRVFADILTAKKGGRL